MELHPEKDATHHLNNQQALTAAFALTHRPGTAIPALLAGVVQYGGMYAQSRLTVMYAGIALGYTVWIGLYLWVRGAHRTGR